MPASFSLPRVALRHSESGRGAARCPQFARSAPIRAPELTEFLPVSSTGHLTIVEKLLGLRVDDPGVTAFTAIIQVGAIIGGSWLLATSVISAV